MVWPSAPHTTSWPAAALHRKELASPISTSIFFARHDDFPYYTRNCVKFFYQHMTK
jgi:hypothetical protein